MTDVMPETGEARWMNVSHEVAIAATPERVWLALTDEIGRWWNPGFYALPNAKGMRLDARIGGALYEHADDGSAVVWGTVIAVQAGRSIDIQGNLSVAFGGPAHVLMRFGVEVKDGATVASVSEARIGLIADDAPPMTRRAWKVQFEKGLKPWCERA